MSEPEPGTAEARAEAARLYAEARGFEARHDYHAAREAYAASLRLQENEAVLSAYLALMAKIGPAE